MVIRHYVGEHPGCEGMGTTATLLHIDEQDGQAYWAHVGDSRLYLLRSGTEALAQITRDHSYVEDLVREGTITPEEAKKHPQRNMLTRAVGVERVVRPDYYHIPTEEGFMVLLCSDGLSGYCTDTEILGVIRRSKLDELPQALVDLALEKGGRDNISLAVITG